MNMIVSGAGLEEINGLYVEEGTYNGKPLYQLYDEDGTTGVFLHWESLDLHWYISDIIHTPFYYSEEDVSTPDLCETWIVFVAGTPPAPTVTKAVSPGTLSDLTVSANITISGNVLHVTLDNAVLNATIDVTATASSDITLENLTSSSAIAVKAQASLSRGLDNVSAMAFGEVYTGINSPYQDIVSWTGHPLSGSTVKVRLGNLRGIFGENGEFGLYAGDGWDAKSGLPPNVNSQYIRLGNHTNEFHNVPVKLYDSGNVTMQLEPTSPSFAMGNPLPSGFGVGIGLWQGKDTDGTYKWRIGNPSGSNLSWNGTNLLLQNASLDVSGSNVHIALGNPPPTSKTSGTGIWMDNSGIYGLHNNVKQVYIDTTTGIFYSGAGTVRVDEAGANIVIGTHDEFNRLTGIELNSTGLFGKVADDVRFALANTGVPFLKLGTGEKDVDLTGIQIDETEIVGQNNGVDQVVFSASGKFTAGTGNVILDAGGISMNAPDGSDQWNAPTSLKICSFSQDNIVIGSLRAYTDYEYLAPPAVVLESFGRNADYSENDEYGWSEIYLYAHEGQAHTPRTASIKLLSGMPTIGFEIPSEIELQANRILINSNDYPVQFANNIPLLPSSDPTEDNQATRKAYVDSQIGALGIFQNYAMQWTAATTNPSFGNADVSAIYTTFGTLCVLVVGITMGSTTTYGSGEWRFSLPLPAKFRSPGLSFFGVAHLRKRKSGVGVANHERVVQLAPTVSPTDIRIFTQMDDGTNVIALSATVPFTWRNGDYIGLQIMYEYDPEA